MYDAAFEAFLGVYWQSENLLDQSLELQWSQLVQDATHLLVQLLTTGTHSHTI